MSHARTTVTKRKLTIRNRHIVKTLGSTININGRPETIWDNITNVKIEPYSDPTIFKFIDIPKPLRAEIISEGQGSRRIAYFDSGKKFMQEILVCKPLTEYSFSSNPEKGFKVLYFFELSEGVFQIPTGAYYLTTTRQITSLKLTTTYSIDRRLYFLFPHIQALNVSGNILYLNHHHLYK